MLKIYIQLFCSLNGRVVQSSQEGRSVDCNQLTNRRGEAFCPPPGQQPISSCHVTTTGPRVAELEQENRDLLTWVGEGKCGSGWSSWGGWSDCDQPAACPANQVQKSVLD